MENIPLDFIGFPRDSLLLQVDIRGYPNLTIIVTHDNEGVYVIIVLPGATCVNVCDISLVVV